MAAPSGIVWGSIAGSYGRIGIYVELTNTNTQTTRHTEIWFWSKYSVSDSANTFYYDDNATSATTSKGSVSITTSNDSGEGWSTSNQVKLKEYDYTFDRGTSSSTRSVAAKLTDIDRVGATMSVTTTYTIPALASYTVSYNANGGSGAPSSQTKYYGKTLTLSSTKPTRSGYTFKGWALSKADADDGTWYYQAGGSCGKNENLTLYAVWEEHKLTINYYSNGATSAFADALNAVGSGKNVVVWTTDVFYDNDYSTYGLANYSNSTGSVYMTRTGYTATGKWGTSTSGGTLIDEDTGYSTGQALAKALGKDLTNGNASISLYAQWSENTLTINYHSNGADYGAFNGEDLNLNGNDTTVLTHLYYYDNAYSDGLYNIQNLSKLYLSRTGYNSTGKWGTSASGGTLINEDTAYNTGQALAEALGKSLNTGNASINLYAQWTPWKHTVKYDANGGSGAPSAQTKTYDKAMQVSSIIPTRIGYKFIEWNTKPDGTGTSYASSQAYNHDQDNGTVTLYAIWKISGVVYIDNGTTLEPYLAYIDNGSSWDLYLIYVDNGTDWDIIS